MNCVTALLHGCSIFCGRLTELRAGGQREQRGRYGTGTALRAQGLHAELLWFLLPAHTLLKPLGWRMVSGTGSCSIGF